MLHAVTDVTAKTKNSVFDPVHARYTQSTDFQSFAANVTDVTCYTHFFSHAQNQKLTNMDTQTIEEKLSKIRAINEEKDQVEKNLEQLVRIEETSNSQVSIGIHSAGHGRTFDLPTDTIMEVHAILKEYYEGRKAKLILQATELMR